MEEAWKQEVLDWVWADRKRRGEQIRRLHLETFWGLVLAMVGLLFFGHFILGVLSGVAAAADYLLYRDWLFERLQAKFSGPVTPNEMSRAKAAGLTVSGRAPERKA